MASLMRTLLFPLFLCSILLLNHSVRGDHDEEDSLLQSINAYRASLNLTTLIKNDNAECLADEVAEQFKNQPCTNTTGPNTVLGTEPQFANYPNLLNKCHLNVSNTRDGVVLPACVPHLDSSLVLTNFTRSQYSDYLNDTKFSGIGIGSEDNWIVVVLTTSTPEGSFVPAQNTVNTGNAVGSASFVSKIDIDDDDEDDILLRDIIVHRAALNLTAITKSENADCFADEFADRFQDRPCTNIAASTAGSIAAPGAKPQPLRLSHYPLLLAKCNLIVSNTSDGIIIPVCSSKSIPSLALSNLKQSQFSGYLNDTNLSGIGVGSEDDWLVVVLTSNTAVGTVVPADRTPNIPLTNTPNTAIPVNKATNTSSPLNAANALNTADTLSTASFAPKISFIYHTLLFLIASILLL